MDEAILSSSVQNHVGEVNLSSPSSMVNLISNKQSPHNASQVNLNLSPSAVMEYDIEMFGSKHPDFIGTIFVRNPNNPDETLVATPH